MKTAIIEGLHPIHGEIRPIGNKNSILPIICASVLIPGEVSIRNVPKSVSVRRLLKIFKALGGIIKDFSQGTLVLDSRNISAFEIPNEIAKKERASIMFLGALLSRLGRAKISEVGGCKLGARPNDTLINGLLDLGVTVIDNDIYNLKLSQQAPQDRFIWLQETSVTGTENLLIASVLLPGTTTIYNAASEPHVQDLCNFLVSAGASIEGIGTNKIVIHGVKELHATDWEIISDHIDIGGLIVAAAITGGEISITNAIPNHMYPILKTFEKFNLQTSIEGNTIHVSANQDLVCKPNIKGDIDKLNAYPWPSGVAVDLLPQYLVLALMSEGSIYLINSMYETQLLFTEQLQKLGGKVALMSVHKVITFGKSILKGKVVTAPAIIQCVHALILAGLAAQGYTKIHSIDSLYRRYPNFISRLQGLGAKIHVE